MGSGPVLNHVAMPVGKTYWVFFSRNQAGKQRQRSSEGEHGPMIADPAARMATPAFVTPLCSRFSAQILAISARIRAQKQ